MKIAGRGGHSLDVRGASGILDEVEIDRIITPLIFEYLKAAEHEILDVTPTYSGTSSTDLTVAVQKANAWGADMFFSFHLNAGGGKGTEVIYKSLAGKAYADRVVAKIAALGFTNRGAYQDVRNLYEFRGCVMPNIIVEGFFIDSQIDVDKFKQVGAAAIAKAVAEGIIGATIEIGTKLKEGWYLENGEWYHYTSGNMDKNKWQQDTNGKWFYLGSEGAMAKNTWAQDSSNQWFYLGSDGAMLTSTNALCWCWLDEKGAWDGTPRTEAKQI